MIYVYTGLCRSIAETGGPAPVLTDYVATRWYRAPGAYTVQCVMYTLCTVYYVLYTTYLLYTL